MAEVWRKSCSIIYETLVSQRRRIARLWVEAMMYVWNKTFCTNSVPAPSCSEQPHWKAGEIVSPCPENRKKTIHLFLHKNKTDVVAQRKKKECVKEKFKTKLANCCIKWFSDCETSECFWTLWKLLDAPLPIWILERCEVVGGSDDVWRTTLFEAHLSLHAHTASLFFSLIEVSAVGLCHVHVQTELL